MKKLIVALVLMPMMALADTEVVDGIPWTYTVSNGKAEVCNGRNLSYSSAIPIETTGAITIPSVLGGYQVTSVGHLAFKDCSGLVSVTIPEGVTRVYGDVFRGCDNLVSIIVDENNSGYSSLNGVLYDKNKTCLLICPGRKSGSVTILESVEDVNAGAFSECSGVTAIEVDENNQVYCSLNGILYYKHSFYIAGKLLGGLVRCPVGMTGDLKIPDGVEGIDFEAFSGCSGLTSVTIPSSVRVVWEYAFSGCSRLTSVMIPSSVASIYDGAFYGCNGLKTVRVAAGDTERVKAMIADSYSGIDVDSLTFVEMHADGGPYKETVDGIEWTFMVENGMARIGGGEGGAAISRETLGAVIIPSTLGGCSVVTIGDYAFDGCKGLTSVMIPDGVEVIGESAFENCRHLESITVPAAVKKIDAYAFYGCGRLKTVNYLGEKPEIESTAFMGTGVEQSPSADVVNVVVSNVIVQYVFNSVQPEFAIPATSDTGFVNIITEMKGNNVVIPATWANEYPNFVGKYGSDFTKALTMKSGKKDGAGNEMLVWQDYVAGTDPTDETDVFTASITIVDGKVTISYTPELDGARKAMRKYTTWGKTSLMDTDWTEVPKGDEGKYNFFKVSVEMQ